MKLLSPYHRRPRNLWVSGRLTLFVTILLFRSVIKCHFPSFQLDRMRFRFSVIHHHRYVQTRDTVGRKTSLHARFLCVRPRCRDSWHETHPSLGHSVSVTWSQAPQPASVSAPCHGDTTQVREMIFINHGTWDSGSGNGLQIEGTMPGLARHHYTIINLMSLCEEIWIIEMASHLSLLTAPWCVLRVPPHPGMTVMTSDQYY